MSQPASQFLYSIPSCNRSNESSPPTRPSLRDCSCCTVRPPSFRRIQSSTPSAPGALGVEDFKDQSSSVDASARLSPLASCSRVSGSSNRLLLFVGFDLDEPASEEPRDTGRPPPPSRAPSRGAVKKPPVPPILSRAGNLPGRRLRFTENWALWAGSGREDWGYSYLDSTFGCGTTTSILMKRKKNAGKSSRRKGH